MTAFAGKRDKWFFHDMGCIFPQKALQYGISRPRPEYEVQDE
jgi:hypothetical protein